MEATKNFFCLASILWLSVTSAQGIEEPPPEITTEYSDFSYETTENATESPNDSTTIGDLPEINTEPPIEAKEEEPLAVEEQPLVLFPDNHKNFTPSQYLGDLDVPPYHNHLNNYQQQYKNYYEQKQLYNRKPIKFEENSFKNFYVPSGEDSGGGKKNEYRVNRNPFPYAFEYERGQDQVNWYKVKGHGSTHAPQTPEYVVRGHQGNILPYYIFPHSYPQETLYKSEVDHEHHHHVKDETGGPWKKVFHVLTALVPLGLLLATLTPNVISINSTATTKTTRQRSEESSSLPLKEDVVKLMQKFGVESLTEAQCEDRIICEMAREGGRDEAGPVEKGFWFLANRTPWDIAEKAGMNDLFETIKTGNCEVYKCHPKAKSARKSTFGKKLKRQHKIA